LHYVDTDDVFNRLLYNEKQIEQTYSGLVLELCEDLSELVLILKLNITKYEIDSRT